MAEILASCDGVSVGEEVHCYKASSGLWEEATVLAVREDGRLGVRYSDGGEEHSVPVDRIRRGERPVQSSRNSYKSYASHNSNNSYNSNNSNNSNSSYNSHYKAGNRNNSYRGGNSYKGGNRDDSDSDSDEEGLGGNWRSSYNSPNKLSGSRTSALASSRSSSRIRSLGKSRSVQATPPPAIAFDPVRVGERVVALEPRQGRWYLAVVVAVQCSQQAEKGNAAGQDSYEVEFDHLDVIVGGVPRHHLRLLAGDYPTSSAGEPLLDVGSSVLFPKDREWVTGFVCDAKPDNTYDILDTLGEKSRSVSLSSIRLLHEDDDVTEGQLSLSAADDEDFSSRSDTGTEESKSVESERARLQNQRSSSTLITLCVSQKKSQDLDHLHQGSSIEANFKCKGKWLPGVITKECGDNTFDIKYENGYVEREVSHFLVRPLRARFAKATSTAATLTKAKSTISPFSFQGVYMPTLSVGDQVVACELRQGRWYVGQIVRYLEGRDGALYDVKFDHLDAVERDLSRKFVRLLNGDHPVDDFDRPVLTIGCDVIYLRDGEWVTGFVEQVGKDNKYDVIDELGERSKGIRLKDIRLIEDDAKTVSSAVTSSGARPSLGRQASKVALEVSKKKSEELSALQIGTRIEGNYECKGKWLPGVIVGLGPDGTYHVHYDSGYQEEEVSHFLVKPVRFKITKATSTTKPMYINDGANDHAPLVFLPIIGQDAEVVAYEKQQGKWYTGIVVSQYGGKGETFYDIKFDHLDMVERDLPRHHIRLLFGDLPLNDDRHSVLQAGMSVIFRKEKGWMSGFIAATRENQTYDVVDDLGERSANIPLIDIRLIENKSADNRTRTEINSDIDHAREVSKRRSDELQGLQVNARVEANYQCQGKWLTGLVAKVCEDNTYDIKYDNGYEEEEVSHFLVRQLKPRAMKATSLTTFETTSSSG